MARRACAAFYKTSISSPAQGWTAYPPSPMSTSEYPYQIVYVKLGEVRLVGGSGLWSIGADALYVPQSSPRKSVRYNLTGGAWVFIEAYDELVLYPFSTLVEANHDVYNLWNFTSVYFSKTTTPEQDNNETSASSKTRVRNLHHKTSILIPASSYQKWTGYPDSPDNSSVYPYQLIATQDGSTYLMVSDAPIVEGTGPLIWSQAHPPGDLFNPSNSRMRLYFGGVWGNPYGFTGQAIFMGGGTLIGNESNHNINAYPDGGEPIWFSKTTTPTQDGNETSVSSEVRARGAFWLEKTTGGTYQQWTGYPQSPNTVEADSRDYIYHVIARVNGVIKVCCFYDPNNKPYALEEFGGFGLHVITLRENGHAWELSGGVWVNSGGFTGMVMNLRDYPDSGILESNCDVYTDSSRTTIAFAKTTTPAQDAGQIVSMKRINT